MVSARSRTSRSSVAVSSALLLSALIGIAQSVVLIAIVHEGEGTDAFLAAYSVYLPVTLVGVSLRGSLVPIFGPNHPENAFRERATEACSRAALLALTLSLIVLFTAPLVAQAVTNGLSPAGQRTAVISLAVLAPAAFFQYHAASLSSLLAAARRFQASALIYVATSLAALAVSAALLPLIGPVGAAVGLVAGTAMLAGLHEVYVRRFGIRVRLSWRWLFQRQQLRISTLLIAYASLGLAQQINLSIALGAVSRMTGLITVYTFAFYLIGMLLNLTSMSLSFVMLPDLVSAVARAGIAGAREYVLRVLTFAFPLIAPMLALYLAYGRPLLLAVAARILTAATTKTLFDLGAVFCLLVLPVTLIQVGVSVGVAMRRWRLMLLVSGLSIALQAVGLGLVVGHRPISVASTQVVVTAITASMLIIGLFGSRALRLLLAVVRTALPAVGLSAACVLPALLVRASLGPGAAALGALVSICVYTWLMLTFQPSVGRVLASGLRRLLSS